MSTRRGIARLAIVIPGIALSCGTASGASSSGGGGGNARGAGGQAPEACLDAIDNNGDGDVDCADAQCTATHACVDGPTSGWVGALFVQRIPAPAAAPMAPCPDGTMPTVFHAGPSPAACAPCACELVGGSCGGLTMRCGNGCIDPTILNIVTPTDTACHSATPPFASIECRLTSGGAVVSKGTCMASGGALATPEPWAEEVRVCSAAGGGCAAGQVCAPKIPAGFEPDVCIGQEGTAPCPAEWSDLDLLVFEGGTDTRACSECGCDESTVACTPGEITISPGGQCAPEKTLKVSGADCQSLQQLGLMPPDFTFSFRAQLPEITGVTTCIPAAPSGAVTTTGPHRICCKAAAR